MIDEYKAKVRQALLSAWTEHEDWDRASLVSLLVDLGLEPACQRCGAETGPYWLCDPCTFRRLADDRAAVAVAPYLDIDPDGLTAVVGLLTDLQHWCDMHALDFEWALGRARAHHDEEGARAHHDEEARP